MNTPIPRYVVGIDLGTTNSAMSYVDTEEHSWRIRTLPVPQLIAPGQVEPRESLPSFHYQPAEGELPEGSLRLPWTDRDPDYAVGVFAREHGRLVPGRLIESAKSWLCHPGVDRRAPLLPWHGAPDVAKLSPIEAGARYLKHLREAWDAAHPDHPLAEQDLVLTLPASFDEMARELTVESAKRAGLPRVVLIEEPQAAFYSWIHNHRDDWENLVEPGQKILVCDIGGGTSDFTLIRVRRGEGDRIQFHRVAVGEHLILGGDNLDLALAHHIERRLAGDGKLEPRQWSVLVRTCRHVKETLLGANAPDRYTVTLPGTGARVIGGGLQVEVTREEVEQILVDGFLPRTDLQDKPVRRTGFQEFGLPYAPDPAITRYLATFLKTHRDAGLEPPPPPLAKGGTEGGSAPVPDDASPPPLRKGGSHADPAHPDIVLFNGGFFASPLLRGRLLDVLQSWFRDADPDWQPVVLDNERLDLAVSRGAAYYGMVRRGEGVRIAAGLARTYYIGIEQGNGGIEQGDADKTPPPLAKGGTEGGSAPAPDPPLAKGNSPAGPTALCLVPAGVEPGHEVDLSRHTFDLSLAEPVEFPLYVSSTRLTDAPGELIPVNSEEMTSLPPIRTVLRTSRKRDASTATVELHARLTEIGTLDLWCSELEGRRSWQLQFDVRAATQTDVEAHTGLAEQFGVLERETVETARRMIVDVFGNGDLPPSQGGTEGGRTPQSLPPSEGGTKGGRAQRRGDQPPTAPRRKGEGRGEKPGGLPRRIARSIGMSRNDWPPTLLRRMWEALMEVEPGRRKSREHEARWLNLLGFALRPGYGMAVDDWRVAETWRVLQGRLVHSAPMCRAEWWVLWRRIGGGLEAGQQNALAAPLLGMIRQRHRQLTTGKGRGADLASSSHEEAEIWRMLGSLELLDSTIKLELGRIILDLLPKRKMDAVRPALAWALGRIGTRTPVYGPLNTVVPIETAAVWLDRLLEMSDGNATDQLAAMQLARRTGDRYRDVPEPLRERVLDWLDLHDAPAHFLKLVREAGTLETEEQSLVFGESLPKGLRIR